MLTELRTPEGHMTSLARIVEFEEVAVHRYRPSGG